MLVVCVGVGCVQSSVFMKMFYCCFGKGVPQKEILDLFNILIWVFNNSTLIPPTVDPLNVNIRRVTRGGAISTYRYLSSSKTLSQISRNSRTTGWAIFRKIKKVAFCLSNNFNDVSSQTGCQAQMFQPFRVAGALR
jgi:hypothetical protein